MDHWHLWPSAEWLSQNQINYMMSVFVFLKIELTQLETVLSKDQATFPDNPSVWLLDLASLLNLKLENVPESDPLFEDKPQGMIQTLIYMQWY